LGNPSSDKVVFIKAFFDEIGERIENLAKLNASTSFRTEALMLSLVYIDGLASNYYAGGDGKNKEDFCRALRELSEDPLFGKLHAKMLLDPDNDKYWAATRTDKNASVARIAVEELAKGKPGELLDESEVAERIRSSAIDKETKDSLIHNLWRSSVGAICYDMMRTSAVHSLGTSALSFDQSLYEGKLGFTLDFERLLGALRHICGHIGMESVETGEWFGRKD
jgi:hypothetical protein